MLEPYGDYRFRALADGDAPFVRALYHATLRGQLPLHRTSLTEAGIEALLDQQLAAQTEHYRVNHPQAETSIVEHLGVPVARLIIVEFSDEVRLGDLMVTMAHRKHGLCSYIMDRHVALGLATGRPIRLHVEKWNPAIALYRRKSFAVVEDLNSHWLMEYRPGVADERQGAAPDQLKIAS